MLNPLVPIILHCKKKLREWREPNDVEAGKFLLQRTVLWFCATVVNIGIWHIPTWLFYSVLVDQCL